LLDGDVISLLLGCAGMALLLAIFVVSVVRWCRAPSSAACAGLVVGACFCFAFGQAGSGMRLDNGLQVWVQMAIIAMIVAFTAGRLAIGFAAFAAMAAFVVLAAFGAFADPVGVLVLLPVLVLVAAIVARYFPGGARLVPLPANRAARVTRTARLLVGGRGGARDRGWSSPR
jgi:hypothetical protein